MMQPAVFLDRDGTMIEDGGYVGHMADVRWFPYTADAIRLLNRAGYLVCVTTNQAGVARGYYTESDVKALHEAMAGVLAEGGARVDGWFYCPHHPTADVESYRIVCGCRKPEPGLIGQARARFPIDVERSFVVGDKLADVESAARVGARGVLVRTGYGDEIARTHVTVPHAAHVAADLMAAVSWVLSQRPDSPGTT